MFEDSRRGYGSRRRKSNGITLSHICFGLVTLVLLLGLYSVVLLYKELPTVNLDVQQDDYQAVYKDSLKELESTFRLKEEDLKRRFDFKEKELLKQKRELENARLQLDLDKSKFQNHKERLYNKPHTPSPTTTTTMTTTTTTATQISTLKPISTPLSSINNLNQHENCRNTLQSTMPCANRTLLSEAWVAPQMSDVLKRKYSSNSLNILIATFEFSGGPKRVGGIGTAYTQLALALAEAGHNVTVLLCQVYRIEYDEWLPWQRQLATKGIRLTAAPLPEMSLTNEGCGWSCIKSFCVMEWLRQQLPFEYDIIHFPENLGLAYFPLLAKRQGNLLQNSAIVVGTHGPHVWERHANQKWMSATFDYEVSYQEQKSVEWADWVVSPSSFLMKWLSSTQNWQLNRDKTVVHQNIITDLPQSNTVRTGLLAADDIKEFIFFGRLETRKGVLLLVDAIDNLRERQDSLNGRVLQRLRNVKLTFLGKDPQMLSEKLRRRCQIWSDAPKCQFELNQDRQTALSRLQEDGVIAIVPSLTENSPYTVVECVHLGVPILASNVGGIPELITPASAQSSLFDGNVLSLADALQRVLLNGLQRAQLHQSPQSVRDVWLQFHQQIALQLTYEQTDSQSISPSFNTHSSLLTLIVVANNDDDYDAILELTERLSTAVWHLNKPVDLLIVSSHMSPPTVQRLQQSTSFETFARKGEASVRVIDRRQLSSHGGIGDLRNFAVEHYAKGEFVMFVDLRLYLRSRDALVELFRVAERRQADVVTAQVFDGSTSGLPGDTDTSQWDAARLARHSSLYVGCNDDAALGMVLNCYGGVPALIRRAAYLAVGGFASNVFGTADQAWQLYATLSLAGYRVEAHTSVLFGRGFDASGGATSSLDVLREPSFAAMVRSVPSATMALRDSPLRLVPMYFVHLFNAFSNAAEEHKQSLAKLQSKYQQKKSFNKNNNNNNNVNDDSETKRADQCEKDKSFIETSLKQSKSEIAQLQHQLSQLKLKVEQQQQQLKQQRSKPIITSNQFDDNQSMLDEISNLKRKLNKKCPPQLAQSIQSTTVSDRPPGVVIIKDSNGDEIKQRIVLVRGHEKSGTTWLRSLLGLHPMINMVPKEFQFNFVSNGIDRFTSEPWMGSSPSLARLANQWYDEFVHTLLSAVAAKHPQKTWIGEKSPKPLEPLHKGASYVYIVRDGRDVLVSLFWHHVRLGGFKTWCDGEPPVEAEYSAAWKKDRSYFETFPHRLLSREKCVRSVARHWSDVVSADQQILNRIGVEGDEFGTRAMSLMYEDLLDDTDSGRFRAYEFLGLDPTQARQLETWDLTLPGIPADQSRGFFRHGTSGDWQTYFNSDARRWFNEEAGEMLLQLGYESDPDWWKQ